MHHVMVSIYVYLYKSLHVSIIASLLVEFGSNKIICQDMVVQRHKRYLEPSSEENDIKQEVLEGLSSKVLRVQEKCV